MNKEKTLSQQRKRRTFRIRKKLRGTPARPRLCVHRSHRHISCQAIDDESGKTLASASTRDKSLMKAISYGGNTDAATLIGKAIAEKVLATGVKEACFDRGRYHYHGRVAAIAEAAREAGLKF